jgi:DNA-binding NarL/FixJ family response regulator
MLPASAVKLGLVDDHRLFRKGLISLIEMVNKDYTILFEADNGFDLQKKIVKNNPPDIILMDLNMPGMDGFACVQWLREFYPDVKVLVISMIEKEDIIVRMLKLGVRGYLCKDVEPKELGEALQEVANKGFYYTDFVTGKLVHSLQHDTPNSKLHKFDQMNDQEKKFLQFACSELNLPRNR